MPDQWSYAPQGLHYTRPAHISPEVGIVDMPMAQGYGQTIQANASQPMASYQPQQHHAAMPPQRVYQQPAEPVQAASASQSWPTSQAPQLYHPQPQHRPTKRHPLQPDQQSSQAGPSQPRQVQKEQEQVATTQKQLQYLHSLEQQHQRPPHEWQQSPAALQQAPAPQQPRVPQHQPPARRQSAAVPVPPVHTTSSNAPARQAVAQTVQPPPPDRPNLLPTPVAPQPPPNESNVSSSVAEAPATSTQTQSPSKFPRSTRRITLQDLRSGRRHSSQGSQGRTSSAVVKPVAQTNAGSNIVNMNTNISGQGNFLSQNDIYVE